MVLNFFIDILWLVNTWLISVSKKKKTIKLVKILYYILCAIEIPSTFVLIKHVLECSSNMFVFA